MRIPKKANRVLSRIEHCYKEYMQKEELRKQLKDNNIEGIKFELAGYSRAEWVDFDYIARQVIKAESIKQLGEDMENLAYELKRLPNELEELIQELLSGVDNGN